MAKLEREAQKNTAQQRKDRDKAALDKQRYVPISCSIVSPSLSVVPSPIRSDREGGDVDGYRADAAAAKAAKQKKAAKQERRG